MPRATCHVQGKYTNSTFCLFIWPSAMWNEGTSLLDWVPAGLSGFKAILDIAWLFAQTKWDALGGEPDLGNSKYYYQSTKEGAYKEGDAKWFIKFKRFCPYWRSWYTMVERGPYDAYSSYDYGRRMRGK